MGASVECCDESRAGMVMPACRARRVSSSASVAPSHAPLARTCATGGAAVISLYLTRHGGFRRPIERPRASAAAGEARAWSAPLK